MFSYAFLALAVLSLWSQVDSQPAAAAAGGWGGGGVTTGGWGSSQHLIFYPAALAVSFISAGCRFFTRPLPCAPLRLSSCSASRQPAQRLRAAYPATFQHPTSPESTLHCRSTRWSTYPTTAFFLTCTLSHSFILLCAVPLLAAAAALSPPPLLLLLLLLLLTLAAQVPHHSQSRSRCAGLRRQPRRRARQRPRSHLQRVRSVCRILGRCVVERSGQFRRASLSAAAAAGCHFKRSRPSASGEPRDSRNAHFIN